MEQFTTIGNKDLLRIVFWFCGEDTSNGRVFKSNIRLQKIVFLAQKEFSEFKKLQKDGIFVDDELEFEANNFGPFSQDLVEMVRGRFRTEDREISIFKKGCTNIYKIEKPLIERLKKKYQALKEESPDFISWVKKINKLGSLKLDELLKIVYENKKYQDYLVRSKIAHKFETRHPEIKVFY